MSSLAGSMPRRPQPRLLGAAVAAVLAAAAVVAVVLLLTSGPGSSAAHREASYGGIPKWLPRTEGGGERTLTASPAKPALAIQGNTVAVDLSGGHKVLATVVGPEVPEEGQFPVPATSPCTFVVTFAKGSTAVPIVPADFTVTDEQGHLHHPKLTAMGGGPPPTVVPAGRQHGLAEAPRRLPDRQRLRELGPGNEQAARRLGLRHRDRLRRLGVCTWGRYPAPNADER